MHIWGTYGGGRVALNLESRFLAQTLPRTKTFLPRSMYVLLPDLSLMNAKLTSPSIGQWSSLYMPSSYSNLPHRI